LVYQQRALPMQGACSKCHRAGRNDEDLQPGQLCSREIFNQCAYAIQRQAVVPIEEQIGSQFDDDAARVLDSVSHQFIMAWIRRSSFRCSSTWDRSFESGASLM